MYKEEFEYNNKETISKLYTNGKVYIGTAKCHPEDEDKYRQYIGERIAHNRSHIKYVKDEIADVRIRLQEIESLLNTLKNREKYDKNDRVTQIVQKRYWALKEELNDWKITKDILISEIGDIEHAANKLLGGLKS